MFWSSVDLTGNQTLNAGILATDLFWSSVDLTGNQTSPVTTTMCGVFWSSVDLTGNQTDTGGGRSHDRFGAASI